MLLYLDCTPLTKESVSFNYFILVNEHILDLGNLLQHTPSISIRQNLWIIIPIGALIIAILTSNFLLLNYVHVFTSILWTGTDIFMAFLLGPVLREVSISTRTEIILWLIPKMIFFYTL